MWHGFATFYWYWWLYQAPVPGYRVFDRLNISREIYENPLTLVFANLFFTFVFAAISWHFLESPINSLRRHIPYIKHASDKNDSKWPLANSNLAKRSLQISVNAYRNILGLPQTWLVQILTGLHEYGFEARCLFLTHWGGSTNPTMPMFFEPIRLSNFRDCEIKDSASMFYYFMASDHLCFFVNKTGNR